MRQSLAAEELFDQFYVDTLSPSGIRYTKGTLRRKADDVAGYPSSGGYYMVYCRGYGSIQTARVVLILFTGRDIEGSEVDHIDRNRANNHPFNLRWATARENSLNRAPVNKTGFTGVTYIPRYKNRPFRAMMRKDGKKTLIGHFSTAEEAYHAYLAATSNHGEYL